MREQSALDAKLHVKRQQEIAQREEKERKQQERREEWNKKNGGRARPFRNRNWFPWCSANMSDDDNEEFNERKWGKPCCDVYRTYNGKLPNPDAESLMDGAIECLSRYQLATAQFWELEAAFRLGAKLLMGSESDKTCQELLCKTYREERKILKGKLKQLLEFYKMPCEAKSSVFCFKCRTWGHFATKCKSPL